MTTFDDIEAALRKIAADNDLTYVSFDLHVGERTFWSAKGHREKLAKSGHGPTLEAAVDRMLSCEFHDAAPGIAEDARIMAAGRTALTLAKGGWV